MAAWVVKSQMNEQLKRGGIRGFGALLRAARGISQDFEGKTKKRLFYVSQCYWVTVAHPTLTLSRVKIAPQSSLTVCSSRFWMTETPGQLTPNTDALGVKGFSSGG